MRAVVGSRVAHPVERAHVAGAAVEGSDIVGAGVERAHVAVHDGHPGAIAVARAVAGSSIPVAVVVAVQGSDVAVAVADPIADGKDLSLRR